MVVVLVGAAAGIAYAIGQSSHSGKGTPSAQSGSGGNGGVTTTTLPPLRVASSTPSAGATNVASNANITIHFSAPVAHGAPDPTLTPPVAGTWTHPDRTTFEFVPSAPMIPYTSETVTIPAGKDGTLGTNGATLESASTIGFKVADGSMLRLQQLLAGLNYLPLSFTATGSAPAPAAMAQPQTGNFAWRWTTLPPDLTSQWTPGYEDEITKGAVMSFQNQNGLTVDGLAGPKVWTTLLADTASAKVDPVPYTYVLVSKVVPQNLTLWNNGTPQFTNIAVNTGLHGADTTDGTFAVFEHVTASEMKGTNPDGSKYDDPNVPWASYFDGGEALHGFVRPTYGTPQSNGCVEMPVATAGQIWPFTPIGTLVTVVGPAS
jgi:peptidoglycan hydrolase-like protein with peptidoglycan-binding domain